MNSRHPETFPAAAPQCFIPEMIQISYSLLTGITWIITVTTPELNIIIIYIMVLELFSDCVLTV